MWYDVAVQLYNDWALLLNLGKVNVICGKNNSGKSTILKVLSDKKNYQEQKYMLRFPLLKEFLNELDYPQGDEIYDEYHGVVTNWENGYEPHIADAFTKAKDCLLKLAEIEPNTNYKDIKSLKEKIEAAQQELSTYLDFDTFQDQDTGKYIEEIDFRGIVKVFKDYQELLEPIQNTLFIETQREIDPNQSYFTAKGILKDLFVAKNSRSSDRNKFKKYEELERIFNQISNGYFFSIDVKQMDSDEEIVLSFSKDGSSWYEARHSGLGLRALLLLLYSSILSDANIILIDEPESYLHPSWQRALLKYFKNESSKQYIIASHSNIFLDTNHVDRIFQTKYTTKIEVSDIQEKTLALHDLGYLTIDNLQGDLLILVEGKTDVAVLEELLKTLGYWEDYDIKVLACGGVPNIDSMPLETFKSDYNKLMVLLDGDWVEEDSLKVPKNRIEKQCDDLGVYFKALEGYGIENYFPLRVFNKSIDDSKLNSEKTKLKLDIKGIVGKKKKNLYTKYAEQMTLKEIEDTGDLYEFLKDIMEICDNSLPKK